jgi:hypothetical protein
MRIELGRNLMARLLTFSGVPAVMTVSACVIAGALISDGNSLGYLFSVVAVFTVVPIVMTIALDGRDIVYIVAGRTVRRIALPNVVAVQSGNVGGVRGYAAPGIQLILDSGAQKDLPISAYLSESLRAEWIAILNDKLASRL